MDNIKKVIYECANKFNITINNTILFGSRASGTFDENSDYDILVVINENIENELKIKLSCIITKELSEIWVNADIIVKSYDELKIYENCIGSVVRNAIKKGVSI